MAAPASLGAAHGPAQPLPKGSKSGSCGEIADGPQLDGVLHDVEHGLLKKPAGLDAHVVGALDLEDLEGLLELRPLIPSLVAVVGEVAGEASAVVPLAVEILASVLEDHLVVEVKVVKGPLAPHHVLRKHGLHRAVERVVPRLQGLVLAEPALLPHVQGSLPDLPGTLV
eukprot:UN2515